MDLWFVPLLNRPNLRGLHHLFIVFSGQNCTFALNLNPREICFFSSSSHRLYPWWQIQWLKSSAAVIEYSWLVGWVTNPVSSQGLDSRVNGPIHKIIITVGMSWHMSMCTFGQWGSMDVYYLQLLKYGTMYLGKTLSKTTNLLNFVVSSTPYQHPFSFQAPHKCGFFSSLLHSIKSTFNPQYKYVPVLKIFFSWHCGLNPGTFYHWGTPPILFIYVFF